MKILDKKITMFEQKFDEQLLESFEFYKSAFELSKDPKLVLEDCLITKFNPISLEFFECMSPTDIYNKSLLSFIHEVPDSNLIKTKCAGNVILETEIITCRGNKIPVSINFDNISKNGKQKTIATIHDITERVTTRNKLKDNNLFINTVLDNLPIGIAVKTKDHHIVKYANENFSKIMGWPKEVTYNFDEYFDSAFPYEGEAEKIKQMVLSSLENEKLVTWKMVKTLDMDGLIRFLTITMLKMKSQDSIITMVQNVTQEVKDQAWLKVKSAAVKAIHNSVVITNIDGTILWVNPSFEKEYGYSSNEIVGKSPNLLKSGTHDEAFYKNMWGTILAGKVWKGRICNKRKDGSTFWDVQSITPVRAGGAEITHFIAIKNLSEHELDIIAN